MATQRRPSVQSEWRAAMPPEKGRLPGLSTPEHQAQRLCQTGAILDLILLSRPAEPFSSDVKVLSFFMGIVTRI
jgi:hypothetical protein